jgi:soluble lytic murein transglycosylase-like protein
MSRPGPAILLLLCALLGWFASTAAGESLCRPAVLPGLQSAWGRAHLAQRTRACGPRTRHEADGRALEAAASEDFLRVAAAVLGLEPDDQARLESVGPAFSSGARIMVTCGAGVLARDRAARRLVASGYSAREIADLLTGRLTRAELDTAQRLLMAGYGPTRAQAFLDAAIAARRRAPERRYAVDRRDVRDRPQPAPLPAAWRTALASYSATHGVDPTLVHAVVTAESGGIASAISPVGAVGLMQLMPATARMLGVDPFDPLDNLRGGIAYLGSLLAAYGDVRLALIAYNAGPSHADRVARGEAVPYDETRRYLDAIARRYPFVR